MRLPSAAKCRASLILPLMLILNACAAAPSPVADACSWASLIIPDAGFETRWTTAEKRQVDAYDKIVQKECPAPVTAASK